MNVYEYIALGNRFGASQIVSQFGMQPADNPADLSRQLATAVMRGGEEALQRVMMMHPDASYFLGEHQKAKKDN